MSIKIVLPENIKREAISIEERPGGWSVVTLENGKRKWIRVCKVKGKTSLSISGKLWHGELSEFGSDRAQSTGADHALDVFVSQFPGKVRKIVSQSGSKVKKGDSILLLEAMKMEFAIKAPKDGTVMSVLVKEGQLVSPGDRLVDFE